MAAIGRRQRRANSQTRTVMNLKGEMADKKEGKNAGGTGILYQVEETAPWHITLMFVIQTVVLTAPGLVVKTSLVHSILCGGQDYGFLAELVAISVIICGVGTILQIICGIRLPIMQGLALSFLPALRAAMSNDKYKCPEDNDFLASPWDNVTLGNNLTIPNIDVLPPWNFRIRVASGSLMVAASIQALLGLTGVFGLLLPFIGPLTIAPAVSLIGLSLYPAVIKSSQHQWGISILTATIMITLAIGLRNIKVPLPTITKKDGCARGEEHYLFRLLPKLVALAVPWLLCYILTMTDIFPNNPSHHSYKARTDVKMESLYRSKWFFIPYPGRWGLPLFDAGIMVSFLVAGIVSMFGSIGDYHVLASCCKKPAPPKHALNRGLAVEGLANILCGSLNFGIGTAAYTEPISFINVSGMASRLTWLLFGVCMIFAGVIGKFSGALAMIPDPILGGFYITGLGMMVSVGVSNLQHVDMNSSRNLMIFGVSVIMGLSVPGWLKDNPGTINTGNITVDDIITALLANSMFVGAFLGFTMDNLLPGTPDERGLTAFRVELGLPDSVSNLPEPACSVYDLPLISFGTCSDSKCCAHIPFLPLYRERECCPTGLCIRGNSPISKDRKEPDYLETLDDNLEKPFLPNSQIQNHV